MWTLDMLNAVVFVVDDEWCLLVWLKIWWNDYLWRTSSFKEKYSTMSSLQLDILFIQKLIRKLIRIDMKCCFVKS